ncbi:MAG: DUF305 domain-containing protein [Oscillochloris sp.]|nr:DUF305 domain-containing protein [Oscillochloris sp.]
MTIDQTLAAPSDAPRPLAIFPLRLFGLLLIAALLPATLIWIFSRPPAEGSAEARFARDMSFHHEQAVEMALIIRDRTADPDLRTIASDIVLTQQNQIGQMTGWLTAWGLPFASIEPPMNGMGLMMGMAPQTEVNALRDLPLDEAEIRFLQLMISHHEGGVMMAEDVLKQSPHPAVERLASAMAVGQRGEIELMTELLARRGAEPPPPLQPMQH